MRWRASSTRRIGRPTQRPPTAAASGSVAGIRPSRLTRRRSPAIGVDRLGERAADEHVGEVLAVLGAAVHVGRRVDRLRRRTAGLGERLAAGRGAVEHLLGRLDAQRDLVDAADDDARLADDVAVEVERDGRGDDREVAVAAGELVQRGVRARGRGKRTSTSSSPGSSALVKKPRKKSAAGISRSPSGPSATTVASSSTASMHHSADGSAWATEPPNVPRVRIG